MLSDLVELCCQTLKIYKHLGLLLAKILHNYVCSAGANDFGSIMIEENVVSAAGAPHRFTAKSIQDAIKQAGYDT
jgi:cyclic dehypoxanthinyl futalosine synthase